MENPLPSNMLKATVTQIPLFIVQLHRLTRLGRGSFYSPLKTLVSFDLSTPEGATLKEKFPPLRDAERVTLIYHLDDNKRVTL